jgi:hypothetical protein
MFIIPALPRSWTLPESSSFGVSDRMVDLIGENGIAIRGGSLTGRSNHWSHAISVTFHGRVRDNLRISNVTERRPPSDLASGQVAAHTSARTAACCCLFFERDW